MTASAVAQSTSRSCCTLRDEDQPLEPPSTCQEPSRGKPESARMVQLATVHPSAFRSDSASGRLGVAIRPFDPPCSPSSLTLGNEDSVRGLGYTQLRALR